MMIGMRTQSVYCPCTALTGPCPVPPQALKQNRPMAPQGSVPGKASPGLFPWPTADQAAAPTLLAIWSPRGAWCLGPVSRWFGGK